MSLGCYPECNNQIVYGSSRPVTRREPRPVRQIRFHDLRHTTASLLMMAGVNPGAVQRILRHSDPRITTETYGHHQPDYLRTEIDRLRFNTQPTNDPSSGSQPSAALGQKVLTRTSIRVLSPSDGGDFREEIQ